MQATNGKGNVNGSGGGGNGEWTGKNVLVLGLGDTGLTCVRWLSQEGARLRCADTRQAPPALGEIRTAIPGLPIDLGPFNSWAWFFMLAMAGKLIGSIGPVRRWLKRVSAVIIWISAAYLVYNLARVTSCATDRSMAEKTRRQEFHSTRSLIDKLGVKPDSKVIVSGIKDEIFWLQLGKRTHDIVVGPLGKDCDVVFFAANSLADLKKLGRLKKCLKPNGAIWVMSLKGAVAKIRDVDVISAAKAAGLVDNKVVSFSETHTSLRVVIPLDQRSSTRDTSCTKKNLVALRGLRGGKRPR